MWNKTETSVKRALSSALCTDRCPFSMRDMSLVNGIVGITWWTFGCDMIPNRSIFNEDKSDNFRRPTHCLFSPQKNNPKYCINGPLWAKAHGRRFYWRNLTDIRAWKSNCTSWFLWDAIISLCHNLSGGYIKPLLKLYAWVNAGYYFTCMYLLYPCANSKLV